MATASSAPATLPGYIADSLTDEAIRFIRRAARDPYFLYLAYNTPHAPYQVPDAYFNRFNAGLRARKGSIYEGGTRSPLYVRWPNRIAPRQTAVPAAHIDILPTLMDLTGEASSLPTRPIFTHADQQPDPTQPYPGCVRLGRYKMVNGKELYDLQTDLGEQHNLAAQDPAFLRELTTTYERWFASTLTGFTPGAPPILVGHREENPARLTLTLRLGASCDIQGLELRRL